MASISLFREIYEMKMFVFFSDRSVGHPKTIIDGSLLVAVSRWKTGACSPIEDNLSDMIKEETSAILYFKKIQQGKKVRSVRLSY